jgi:lipopolysaccharide export system protein LptC
LQLPARKIFLPLSLLALAGMSAWLFQGQPDKGRNVTTKNQNTPDSFMENFTSRTMDAQGRPQYQLQATHMAHYADDDRSELTQPRFTAYRPGGQRWTIEAESGLARDGAQHVFLNGAVNIARYPAANAPANLQIRTRDVHVRTADDYAETDQPTVIEHNTGAQKITLNSMGLQMDFRKGQVQLLSQVKGKYAP